MSHFPIEKNIPMPKIETGAKGKYPWNTLQVGESFFVPDKQYSDIGSLSSRASMILGVKFAVRTVEGGVRVWRTQ